MQSEYRADPDEESKAQQRGGASPRLFRLYLIFSPQWPPPLKAWLTHFCSFVFLSPKVEGPPAAHLPKPPPIPDPLFMSMLMGLCRPAQLLNRASKPPGAASAPQCLRCSEPKRNNIHLVDCSQTLHSFMASPVPRIGREWPQLAWTNLAASRARESIGCLDSLSQAARYWPLALCLALTEA